MRRPRWRLQSRLMLAFCAFTLLTAAVFAFYAVAFMYVVEDAFFDAMLEQEAAAQLRHHAETGQWAKPRERFIRLYQDPAGFPHDLAERFAKEPSRSEIPGSDARHYHLLALDPPAPAARVWLLAEVSEQLVVRPMRERVFVLLASSGLLLVAVALLAGYWLARRIAGPLARLAGQVDAMSPEHQPSNFAHAFQDREVGVLARGLEALASRVHAFVAREQAFTRDASHELRTPLAVILGAAERLAAEPGLSGAGRQHLGDVRQSVMQLEQTVAMLLSLAREEQAAESGAPAAIEPVLVVPVLERVIVEQAPLLDGREVAVEVALPDDVRIAVPPAVLHILLSNLVGNAFAHTQTGQVRIDVHCGRLRIANSGDGSDPATCWQSGRPFSKREGSSGVGLGLAIVRRLCDRYGIDLCIDSDDGKVVASIAIA